MTINYTLLLLLLAAAACAVEIECIDGSCASSSSDSQTTFVIMGATGDLSRRKIVPALYNLYAHDMLPPNFAVVGTGRRELARDAFIAEKVTPFLPDDNERVSAFVERIHFHGAGTLSTLDAFIARHIETEASATANRIFYLALPPSAFEQSAVDIDMHARAKGNGYTRLVVEKPFGSDLASFEALQRAIGALWSESELYRIDHYLGKAMVQNLATLLHDGESGNAAVFDALRRRGPVKQVTITFAETIGSEGRAYFDEAGIVRDVMQNHLLQLLALVAMEAPASADAEAVRDAKVALLDAIEEVRLDDALVAQYDSYASEQQRDDDSLTATFARLTFYVDNERWRGVPFVMQAGKALDEARVDINLAFEHSADSASLNFRVQPVPDIALRVRTNGPGLAAEPLLATLSSTEPPPAKPRFGAYDKLVLDIVAGDHTHFVRADELKLAWQLFTPVLEHIEHKRIRPLIYRFGASPDQIQPC
jgi:glucose-6-phosphate 1-dehydrogenase